MAEYLRISSSNRFSEIHVEIDGTRIPNVAAYTIQEGYFTRPGEVNRVYTRKLTLEILLDLNQKIELHR